MSEENNLKDKKEQKEATKLFELVGLGITCWANMEGILVLIGGMLIDTTEEKAGSHWSLIERGSQWVFRVLPEMSELLR